MIRTYNTKAVFVTLQEPK